MSSEAVVERQVETKKNSLGVNCLLWRMCPVSTFKEKVCIHKGSPSCKEFIRWLNNSEGRYTGDLR
jgi:hypothetical protein